MRKLFRYLKNWRRHLTVAAWLAGHTRPYMPRLLLLLLLSAVTSGSGVILAMVLKTITDVATGGQVPGGAIGWYVGISLVSIIIGTAFSIFSTLVNERFAFGIRSRVYDSILHTYYADISAYHSGDLVTRLTSDIDIVARGISEIIPSVFSLIITFIIAFIAMASSDFGLAVFVLCLAPLGAIVSIVMGRKLKPLQAKVQESESAYKSSLQETIANMVVVKAFEGQRSASERLTELRNERLRWLLKRQKIQSGSNALLSASFSLGFVGVIAWSAYRLSTGLITAGTMVMFLDLAPQIQSPLFGLSRMIPQLVSILTSAERIMQVEALPREDAHLPALKTPPTGLKAEQVGFAYKSTPVLQNLSLRVQNGEFVALMGDSGIGKTTLLRLFMAYYAPQQGALALLDGSGGETPIDAGARHYIAYVPQGNTLMSGSIADNLRMGRRDATEEEMWELLEVVAAGDFVRELPDGLQTVIGERGYGLSEGQAQRLAIARALIKKAPILILDEATSALDENTERAVLQHLQRLSPRPACVIVTHRRSVLAYCNRCIRIDDGRISEESIATPSPNL